MSANEKQIKEELKMIGNTVALVTSQQGNLRDATTVAWISRVSNIPPLIMISIAPERFIHKLILESGEFNVAILGEDNEELAIYCGTNTAYEVDKFKEGNIATFKAGVVSAPLINDALVNLECKMVEIKRAGDHTIFIGEAIAAHTMRQGRPLMVTDRLCTLEY